MKTQTSDDETLDSHEAALAIVKAMRPRGNDCRMKNDRLWYCRSECCAENTKRSKNLIARRQNENPA